MQTCLFHVQIDTASLNHNRGQFYNLCLCLSLCVSVCLSLPLSLSVCLSLCQSLCLAVCMSVSVSLSLCLSLSVCLSVSVSLPLPLSVCLSLSLSVSLWTSLGNVCRDLLIFFYVEFLVDNLWYKVCQEWFVRLHHNWIKSWIRFSFKIFLYLGARVQMFHFRVFISTRYSLTIGV